MLIFCKQNYLSSVTQFPYSSSFPNRYDLRAPLILSNSIRALYMLKIRVHATRFTILFCVLPHHYGAIHFLLTRTQKV